MTAHKSNRHLSLKVMYLGSLPVFINILSRSAYYPAHPPVLVVCTYSNDEDHDAYTDVQRNWKVEIGTIEFG